jgi:putative transposase
VRDLAVLFLHLLATVARLAGPGGVRAVVAESVRQAPVTDPESVAKTVAQSSFSRSRGRRSMCVLHPPGPVDPFRDCLQTIDALEPASRADSAEVSPAVLVESIRKAGPQGAQSGRHRRGRRHETAEPKLGMSTDRAVDHAGLRYSYRQGCGATHFGGSVSAEARLCGTVLGHAKDSLWSVGLFRCESAVLYTYWVLVVMDHNPLWGAPRIHGEFAKLGKDQAPRYLIRDRDRV